MSAVALVVGLAAATEPPFLHDEFLNRYRVDCVFRPDSSPIPAAIAPIVDRAGNPTLASAASEETRHQGCRNLIGLWPPEVKTAEPRLNH